MGLIKKYYRQIIAYGFITIGILGLLCLIILKPHAVSDQSLYFCWLFGLFIVIGLTLLLFAGKDAAQ